MPADSELWIPPLSPKDQGKINRRHRSQKALNRFSGFGKRFVGWFSFSGKTFWDLLGIIAIPVVIAVATIQFSAQQSELSAQASEKQHQTDIQIANDQQQETALQTYLDRMSDLLLNDKLHESQPGDEVRNVARARTLTVLPQLNGLRMGKIIRFLKEAGLIDRKNTVIDLSGAELNGILLSEVDLSHVNLSKTCLCDANLRGADLRDADLSGTDLSGADLSLANLTSANLTDANLDSADLTLANLYGAALNGSDIKCCNYVVMQAQLRAAKSLQGTIMPNGSIYP